MRRSGQADLPLHYGKVPYWLAERMTRIGRAIIESIVLEYGKDEVIRRLSDPFWFQSLGAVMGMDWHSSGITTSVIGSLKKAINPVSEELGIYVCGGRGRHSRKTPEELLSISEKTGLDGNSLVRSSRLTAKVDNNAIQDGFQLYLHAFFLTDEGKWSVVQQGMNGTNKMARRYHWHSAGLKSFVEEPHTSVIGENQGLILNLTDKLAQKTRTAIIGLTRENPSGIMKEVQKLVMPGHHQVKAKDVNLKRLGAMLTMAHETDLSGFDELLLLKKLGPRTLQSMALVSEVIYGTPARFKDPARFSFAHGGKDGHPAPVPLKVYDETISVLSSAVERARLGNSDKKNAIKSLSRLSANLESSYYPDKLKFKEFVENEKRNSWKYGGRTVFGKSKPPGEEN